MLRVALRFVPLRAMSSISSSTSSSASISSASFTYEEKNMRVLQSSDSSRAALLENPSGAYTTMRTVQQKKVFRYSQHISRMSGSIQGLLNKYIQTSNAMVTKEEAISPEVQQYLLSFGDESVVNKVLTEHLRHAISGFATSFDEKAIQMKELKLMMLVTFDPTKVQHVTAMAASSVSGERSLPEEGKANTNVAAFPKVHFTDIFDIVIHVSLLGDIPCPPVKAQVRYGHRNNPLIKDSAWVHEAKALEKMRQPDENEVIMVHDNVFLEGLSSNFFAIDQNGTVMTAGSGVLKGTVQQMVLDVCRKHSIPVQEEAPRLNSKEKLNWQGCFITSTSRLCLPIDVLSFPEDDMRQGSTLTFDPHAFPLAYKIQALVAQEIDQQSEAVL